MRQDDDNLKNVVVDTLFRQYAARIDYLISEGYPEDEALRLVRDDVPLSEELWRRLIKTYQDRAAHVKADRGELEASYNSLQRRYRNFVDELRAGRLSTQTKIAFYQAVDDFYGLSGQRKRWDELSEEQREQVRERFSEDEEFSEDQYNYEVDGDGNVITRWPRPSLSG